LIILILAAARFAFPANVLYFIYGRFQTCCDEKITAEKARKMGLFFTSSSQQNVAGLPELVQES